jgi:hypothetical protein
MRAPFYSGRSDGCARASLWAAPVPTGARTSYNPGHPPAVAPAGLWVKRGAAFFDHERPNKFLQHSSIPSPNPHAAAHLAKMPASPTQPARARPPPNTHTHGVPARAPRAGFGFS